MQATAVPVLGLFNLGTGEIIIIALVILLLFGAKRLPDLARSMGRSISEFKKASSEAEREIKQAVDAEAPKPASEARKLDTPPAGKASAN